ncbi:hypothetical protein BUALT_Bualt16G0065700 [Buddleja alternifolia]|uniref:DUF4216 domain-containing protein n=1 Tax=Buddleja alternifolia TaxID=168488 RepID=A0AAV6WG65_9LAMI|nr:hypothetical protein BUALT_Bualt16G0065700 [Buddleja alternifolia]
MECMNFCARYLRDVETKRNSLHIASIIKERRNASRKEIDIIHNHDWFKSYCDWVNNDKGGLVEDIHKFKLVNFSRLMYRNNLPSDEPFILSNQVEQVWYVSDPVDPDLSITITMARRDDFDVYSRMFETELYGNQELDDRIPLNDDDVNWVRDEVEGTKGVLNQSGSY